MELKVGSTVKSWSTTYEERCKKVLWMYIQKNKKWINMDLFCLAELYFYCRNITVGSFPACHFFGTNIYGPYL